MFQKSKPFSVYVSDGSLKLSRPAQKIVSCHQQKGVRSAPASLLGEHPTYGGYESVFVSAKSLAQPYSGSEDLKQS